MPKVMVRNILRVRTHGSAKVWRWGGHYRTVKDAMHFEVAKRQATATEPEPTGVPVPAGGPG